MLSICDVIVSQKSFIGEWKEHFFGRDNVNDGSVNDGSPLLNYTAIVLSLSLYTADDGSVNGISVNDNSLPLPVLLSFTLASFTLLSSM